MRNISLLPWILRTVLYCGLSGSLFFAVAGLSGTLGLQYNVGYAVLFVDLVVISKFADSLIWLVTLLITSAASFVLTILSDRSLERNLNVAFLLAAVPQISLYLLNEHRIAFFTSVAFGVGFLAASILLYKRRGLRFQPRGVLLSGVSFLIILVIIESIALASRTLSALYGSSISLLLIPEQLQTQMSGLMFLYSPILMLAAIFIWAPMLGLIYRRHIVIGKTDDSAVFGRVIQTGRKSSIVLLCVAIAVAIFVPLSPYLRQPALRGVDVLDYYSRLSSISSLNDASRLIAFDPEAPYLILLYVIKMATGWNSHQVIIVGPVFLATFYVVAVYFLTKEISRSSLASGVAALFAASWLHTTVGLFAAIYANWLAISFAVLFTYFVSKAIRKGSNKHATLLAVTLAYATAFSHIWTWAILMAANILAFALLIPIHGRDKTAKRHLVTYGLILLISILPMLALVLVLGSTIPGLSSAFAGGYQSIVGSMSVARLNRILFLITLTTQNYVGAILSYGWALVLTILGAIILAKNSQKPATILAVWLLVTSLSTVLLDQFYQWRVLYSIPFEVYAAIGVLGLVRGLDRVNGSTANNQRLIGSMKFLLVALMALDSINRALMTTGILPLS